MFQDRTPKGALRGIISSYLLLSLSAPAFGAAGTRVVVVFDIQNQGAALSDQELSSMTDYLGTKLGAGGAYRIVPRSEILRRLQAKKRESYKACYDQQCQIEIGRELAAQLTVSTRIGKVGRRCIVTAALYELKAAASVQTATAESLCSADALLVALAQVASGLRGPVAAASPTTASGAPRVERIVERVVERTYERKSVLAAVVLAFLPGGGMYYVGKWGWGLTYTIGIVTGMGLMVAGLGSAFEEPSGAETAMLVSGLVLFYGGFITSAVHSGVAASNWRPPNERRPVQQRSQLVVPILRGTF